MNVYEMVTERIIEQLEKGVIPWQKPWTGTKNGAYNRVSRKPYSILNQMLLQHSGEYATFKQWTEAGDILEKVQNQKLLLLEDADCGRRKRGRNKSEETNSTITLLSCVPYFTG